MNPAGHGWRNRSTFNYEDGSSPCDQYERLLRLLVVDASGNTLLGSDQSWSVFNGGPILADSICESHIFNGFMVIAHKLISLRQW